MLQPHEEAKKIVDLLVEHTPRVLEGQACVLWMKEHGTQWRQMEWPGWFFEEWGKNLLIDKIGGHDGPRFGRTKIDYELTLPWDLKMHATSNPAGKKIDWTVLNDAEAIEKCIKTGRGFGFIIAEAEMEFDTDGAFKKWHDDLKGEKSAYVLKKESEKANSRVRKKSAAIIHISAFRFDSMTDVEEGLRQGWLKGFQEGMINSNDNPRRLKIQVNISAIPEKYLIVQEKPHAGR